MQQTSTFLFRGGLNLVSPPIAIPPGQAIAAINYEPNVNGYSRVGGYERFDGRDRPSDSDDPATIAARRALIEAVPGVGPVRGVHVYDGYIWAFRDHADGNGRMYRSSSAGWVEQTFGDELAFTSGTSEFVDGDTVTGGTSLATATIDRVVLRTGTWAGTASGYLVLSNVSGTFQAAEIITSGGGGSATASGPSDTLVMPAGGIYDFTTHNFYGAARMPYLYLCNGQGYAFEWSGSWLAPIRTGTAAGVLENIAFLLAANGDFILAANGDSIILRAELDRPGFVSHYKNHLFLGYTSGSVIFSSIGEPLEYITTTGAGEISFGEEVTGFLSSAATSIVIFGHNRVEYVTGNDSSDFLMNPITDSSGAMPRSAQMMHRPVYLDDGGIHDLNTTAAFGDWRSGTLSNAVEPLMRAKRDAGVQVACSMIVKGKDQYRLFWDDGSGVNLYVGGKYPEILPFNLPIEVFCCCNGEPDNGLGDRMFVGSTDGYVYELDRGLSFDGEPIPAYIRLPFNSKSSPTTRKRWTKFTAEIDSEDDLSVGLVFAIDYGRGVGGTPADADVDAGTPTITTANYDDIAWTEPVQGLLETHLSGIGKNIAVTLITEDDDKHPHTLTAGSFNFSPRSLVR